MSEDLSIDITLPANRRNSGVLKLLRGAELVVHMRCLGRAAGEKAAEAGNPTRDELKRNGDTPTGSYLAPRGVEARPKARQTGFGTHWIPLDPIGGQAQAAEDAGRAGLAIHGGRGDARLVPTAGCIRVLDKDFARLKAAIGDVKGFRVEVKETPA